MPRIHLVHRRPGEALLHAVHVLTFPSPALIFRVHGSNASDRGTTERARDTQAWLESSRSPFVSHVKHSETRAVLASMANPPQKSPSQHPVPSDSIRGRRQRPCFLASLSRSHHSHVYPWLWPCLGSRNRSIHPSLFDIAITSYQQRHERYTEHSKSGVASCVGAMRYDLGRTRCSSCAQLNVGGRDLLSRHVAAWRRLRRCCATERSGSCGPSRKVVQEKDPACFDAGWNSRGKERRKGAGAGEATISQSWRVRA